MANSKVQFTQRQVNRMLREAYGETVTFGDLNEFYEKYGYYPYYIRKDPQYSVSRGVYRIPKPDEPLSKHGPQTDGPDVDVVAIAQDATVVHKQSPDRGSVLVVETSDVNGDENESPAAPTPIRRRSSDAGLKAVSDPKLAFRHDANHSAADIQLRMAKLAHEASLLATVPEKHKAFVPFGDFELVRTIVASKQFFPVFTTGLSGNGKTFFVEQACALENREYIRVNITTETDEDDLIGGFRLRNGETYFELGPIVVAMIRGAVVNLDELDLASPKIMCLQPVLEGKPLTIKKLGVVIKPADGFTVFATANTKGRGDERGRFIGTGLLNEAMLERFPVTIEQAYPEPAVEKKILVKTYESVGGIMDAATHLFFDTLVKWADAIRKTYEETGCEDVVSTRRLTHIVKAYRVFGSNETAQEPALRYCTNRFEPKDKDAFLDLYNKLAPDPAAPTTVGKAPF